MGLRSYIKNTAKTNTNVTGWMGWDLVRTNAKFVKQLIDDIRPPKEASDQSQQAQATFEASMAQYGVTQEMLVKRRKTHLLISTGCFIFACFGLGWCAYLFFKGMFMSSLVALSAAVLMLVYTATEGLSAYMIQQRRLNCTIKEWVLHFFGMSRR